MTTLHAPVKPFQLKIKSFCIWLETKFERRLDRAGFASAALPASAGFAALAYAALRLFAPAPWPLHVLLSLAFALLSFWLILQIVRRFHDLGKTGGLFWALAVPFWALWKMTTLFPSLWLLWVLLCAWPIKLAIELFLKPGTPGPNGYEARAQNR